MRALYGLPYLGSKNKIAKEILAVLPSANNFYDLFAGGCAMTHAAIANNVGIFPSYNSFYINDILNSPMLFKNAINGKYENETRWISRECFFANLHDPYIRWCWSFSNGGRSYRHSFKMEPIQQAFHYIMLFNQWDYFYKLHDYEHLDILLRKHGYLKGNKAFLDEYKNLIGKNPTRLKHNKVIKVLTKKPRNVIGLRSLEALERVKSLKCEVLKGNLHKMNFSNSDYKHVKIKENSIVYCDIPYKVESPTYILKRKNKFNHKEFWEWAESQDFPIFVSEYIYAGENPNKWEVIWQKQVHNCRKANKENEKALYSTEKLFWNKIAN